MLRLEDRSPAGWLPHFPLWLAGWLLLCLWGGSARAEPEWGRALSLATQGPGPREAGQAAALRKLVDQGLAEDAQSGDWACLDLWLRAEWEDDPALPVARAAFLRDWPCSACQEAADWWSARWVLRRSGALDAAPRLARLAATHPQGEWGRRAGELLERLHDEVLNDSARRRLDDSLDSLSGAWWQRRLAERQVHGRLLLLAPLSGTDAPVGQALRLGVESALEHCRAAGESWELTVWDCQSDPLLTREQLALSGQQPLDAVLLPGQPAYLAACAGLEVAHPLLALGYEGSPPQDLNPRLLHFGLDPASLGAVAARWARDSLRVARAITLGPATRASMRLVEGFEKAWLGASPRPELGQKQWYFFGAKRLERQEENLLHFDGAGSGALWLVLGSPREGAILADLLDRVPAGVRVVGDAGLLEALSGRVPANLAGRFFILTDWLPDELSALAGPAGNAGWQRFRAQLQASQGRAPGALETRSYETVRLLALAAARSRQSGRRLEKELAELTVPSLYGGQLRQAGAQAAGPLLLGWTGREYHVLGRRPMTEGTP